jgi:hypothetical protein
VSGARGHGEAEAGVRDLDATSRIDLALLYQPVYGVGNDDQDVGTRAGRDLRHDHRGRRPLDLDPDPGRRFEGRHDTGLEGATYREPGHHSQRRSSGGIRHRPLLPGKSHCRPAIRPPVPPGNCLFDKERLSQRLNLGLVPFSAGQGPCRDGAGNPANLTRQLLEETLANVRKWHIPERADGAKPVGFAPVVQMSTCSAIARASSTSTPRYLTVLSIFR